MKGAVVVLVLILPAILVGTIVESLVEQVPSSEVIWVYGKCYDYFSNSLQCEPDEAIPGRGVSVGSNSIVFSSGCYTPCTPLDKPYSYRKAPMNIDTWAKFIAMALVFIMGGRYIQRHAVSPLLPE